MTDQRITNPPKDNEYTYRSNVMKSDSGNIPLEKGWFALHYSVAGGERPSPPGVKRKRRKMHGKWYAITGEGGTIYRLLRFGANIDKDHIALDWHGWLELSDFAENNEEPLELTIEPATLGQKLWGCWWNHPILHDRLAIRIATVLGGISVLLGFLSFLPVVCSWFSGG